MYSIFNTSKNTKGWFLVLLVNCNHQFTLIGCLVTAVTGQHWSRGHIMTSLSAGTQLTGQEPFSLCTNWV